VAAKPCVFIHTNHRQLVGALVSSHSLARNSRNAERFEVRILHTQDHPFLREREGQLFLRDAARVVWRYEDLQSFTPLRFMPPELMGYAGRAVVIDPDVFAVGDVWELLARDMQGKAIVCRPRSGSKGFEGGMASSVMLLDCEKLRHWRCERDFAELFAFERDYIDWICLKLDFDHLTPETRLIHNTKRQTQPWKTGLPADFTAARKRVKAFNPATWLRPLRRRAPVEAYTPHPDPNQERFFFGLLRECLEKGIVSEALLRDEMRQNHVRHDAFRVLEHTPPLAA
jgi:hypothetical protein